jgi:hypothetical protein
VRIVALSPLLLIIISVIKIGKIARNRDFFKETIFSQKIVEKIGRFFGDFWAIFLGKNRQKLAGRLQKIVCLKKFRKPRGGGGGGGMMWGGNDVFWCADKGIFALLVLFKKVPTLVKVTFSFIFHFHPFT